MDTGPDPDELVPLQSEVPHPPILRVNETPEFELDTGAALTVMGEPAFFHMFPEAVLQKSSVSLKKYTGEKMKTVGQIQVKVAYQNQETVSFSRGRARMCPSATWQKLAAAFHFRLELYRDGGMRAATGCICRCL